MWLKPAALETLGSHAIRGRSSVPQLYSQLGYGNQISSAVVTVELQLVVLKTFAMFSIQIGTLTWQQTSNVICPGVDLPQYKD